MLLADDCDTIFKISAGSSELYKNFTGSEIFHSIKKSMFTMLKSPVIIFASSGIDVEK